MAWAWRAEVSSLDFSRGWIKNSSSDNLNSPVWRHWEPEVNSSFHINIYTYICIYKTFSGIFWWVFWSLTGQVINNASLNYIENNSCSPATVNPHRLYPAQYSESITHIFINHVYLDRTLQCGHINNTCAFPLLTPIYAHESHPAGASPNSFLSWSICRFGLYKNLQTGIHVVFFTDWLRGFSTLCTHSAIAEAALQGEIHLFIPIQNGPPALCARPSHLGTHRWRSHPAQFMLQSLPKDTLNMQPELTHSSSWARASFFNMYIVSQTPNTLR